MCTLFAIIAANPIAMHDGVHCLPSPSPMALGPDCLVKGYLPNQRSLCDAIHSPPAHAMLDSALPQEELARHGTAITVVRGRIWMFGGSGDHLGVYVWRYELMIRTGGRFGQDHAVGLAWCQLVLRHRLSQPPLSAIRIGALTSGS